MTNPEIEWVSDAYQRGYLRAAFIDCQKGEYICLDDKTPFTIARNFANSLRNRKVPISHFLYDQSKPKTLQPFLYKGAQHHRFPNRLMDFECVIPNPDNEWVYPKETYDGFTNPFSKEVVGNTSRNISPDQKSLLICAGFTARACVQATAIGSFKKAANPDKHHVVIALDATNLHPDYYQDYISEFRNSVDENIRSRIGFAVTEDIIDAAKTQVTLRTSQSSQARPYTA